MRCNQKKVDFPLADAYAHYQPSVSTCQHSPFPEAISWQPSLFSRLSCSCYSAGKSECRSVCPPCRKIARWRASRRRDCIWYFSWSGTADPDPKSANQTEQLLAEPEVRDFVHGIGTAIGAAMKKGAPPTPQGKLLGAEGPKLIHALLTHPAAAFISKFEFGPRGPDVAGGIVVGTGAETEDVKSTLVKLEQTLHTAAAAACRRRIPSGISYPSPPGAPTIEWGFREKYLIVGIGEGSADAIAKRRSGEPPAWLTAIKKRLPIERISSVHFLNIKKLVAATGPG